jgi:cardiolipin synthase
MINNINYPIVITVLRILLAPIIVLAIIYQHWLYALLLVIIAASTDFLDGYTARLLGQETDFGAALDPIADKFLLLSVYSSLLVTDLPSLSLPAWFVWLAFARELMIIMGAAALGILYHFVPIRPTWFSKFTTCIQLLFIAFLLFGAVVNMQFDIVGQYMLFFVAGSLMFSGLQYVFLGLKGLFLCHIK